MSRPLLAAALLAAAAGCGPSSGGVRVTGAVTFKGAPVPAGRVYFDPDAAKNPGGQQGYADIKDGRYDTAGGRAPSAGPVVVRVEGLGAPTQADPGGAMLFAPFEVRAELSGGAVKKDLEVPASAADGLRKDAGPRP